MLFINGSLTLGAWSSTNLLLFFRRREILSSIVQSESPHCFKQLSTTGDREELKCEILSCGELIDGVLSCVELIDGVLTGGEVVDGVLSGGEVVDGVLSGGEVVDGEVSREELMEESALGSESIASRVSSLLLHKVA